MTTNRTRTGATSQDVSALEHLAFRLRQETHGCKPWDRAGVHTVFQRDLVGKNLQICIELVLAHATDPEAKTPAALNRNFTPERRKPRESVVPHRDEQCPRCGGWKGNCHCTREDLAVDAEEQPAPAPIPAGVTGADAARIAAGLTPKETR